MILLYGGHSVKGICNPAGAQHYHSGEEVKGTRYQVPRPSTARIHYQRRHTGSIRIERISAEQVLLESLGSSMKEQPSAEQLHSRWPATSGSGMNTMRRTTFRSRRRTPFGMAWYSMITAIAQQVVCRSRACIKCFTRGA